MRAIIPHIDEVEFVLLGHDASKYNLSAQHAQKYNLPQKGHGSVPEFLAKTHGVNFDELNPTIKKQYFDFADRYNLADKAHMMDRIRAAGLEKISPQIFVIEDLLDKTDRGLYQKYYAHFEFGKKMKPYSEFILTDERDVRSAPEKKRISEIAKILEDPKKFSYFEVTEGLDNASYGRMRRVSTMNQINRSFKVRNGLKKVMPSWSLPLAIKNPSPKSVKKTAQRLSKMSQVAKVFPYVGAVLTLSAATEIEDGRVYLDPEELVAGLTGSGDAGAPSLNEDLYANPQSFFSLSLETQLNLRLGDPVLEKIMIKLSPRIESLNCRSPHRIQAIARGKNGREEFLFSHETNYNVTLVEAKNSATGATRKVSATQLQSNLIDDTTPRGEIALLDFVRLNYGNIVEYCKRKEDGFIRSWSQRPRRPSSESNKGRFSPNLNVTNGRSEQGTQ